MQENHLELIVKLSFWRVLKGVCLGVPFRIKHLKAPWAKIRVPAFPLTFSLLATILACLIGFLTTLEQIEPDLGLDGYITYGVAVAVGWIWVPFVVNFLLLLWCAFLLLIFGRGVNAIRGAQKITYISGFYQMLFYIGAFGIFISGNMPWIICICAILGICRMAAVFECMRRETNGNTFIALMSILGCADVWLLIGMLFMVLYC